MKEEEAIDDFVLQRQSSIRFVRERARSDGRQVVGGSWTSLHLGSGLGPAIRSADKASSAVIPAKAVDTKGPREKKTEPHAGSPTRASDHSVDRTRLGCRSNRLSPLERSSPHREQDSQVSEALPGPIRAVPRGQTTRALTHANAPTTPLEIPSWFTVVRRSSRAWNPTTRQHLVMVPLIIPLGGRMLVSVRRIRSFEIVRLP
ncbi:hypothetical protein PsorP6_007267 [Peronosclerospora sorghi]|uniref:Uncharacterized protein n=1 Tax=Peronosclerospora sorghi TaxID=230839 RepID=A0ACC0WAB1_9STRA|nr:hypothetical protein PsorP6_007267 [Peronosclerospora sorghi]